MKKLSVVILMLVALAVLVGSTALLNGRQKASNYITITTNPTDATIFIDGVSVGTGSGTYPIETGTHTIAATNDAYYEAQQQVEIDEPTEKTTLTLEKKPAQSIEEIMRGSGYTDLVSRYPILKNLPFQQFLYQIDYSPESTTDNLIIVVQAYEGHRGAAINKIKSWGLNPAEYTIVIEPFAVRPADYNYKSVTYQNPFKL